VAEGSQTAGAWAANFPGRSRVVGCQWHLGRCCLRACEVSPGPQELREGVLKGARAGGGGALTDWGVGSHFAGRSRSLAASSTFKLKVLPQGLG